MPYIGTPEGAREYEREQRERARAAEEAINEHERKKAEKIIDLTYAEDEVYADFFSSKAGFMNNITGAYYSSNSVKDEIVKAIRLYHAHFRETHPKVKKKTFCEVK